MIETGLTAGEAARRLGVAVTTLRSWHHRYGLGPTQHEAGHHRRYSADDLARLELMRTLTSQGVPAARAARLARAGAPAPGSGRATAARALPDHPGHGPADEPEAVSSAAVRGLVYAAERLDIGSVRRVVSKAVADLGAAAAWDGLIRPALGRIEAKQAGPHGSAGGLVAVEHLLSRGISEVLGAVPRPATPPQALLTCAAEEQHSLPLEALAAALAQREINAWLLGARLPAPALAAAARRTGPGLVVVWSHARRTADPAPLVALIASRPRPAVVAAAGPGWSQPLPAGVTSLASLPEAVAAAVAVASAAPPAEPGASHAAGLTYGGGHDAT
ncbi:MerR family transcriptional regulator [Natronosporangium hydrolyticum]|uniref:MerR family transcriptional regulator n=1 Tax=Natronosporangium hydrolyticum TaxID=2811111 RepID=A0A895YEF6_9ACTN|nr:MerR family transcriptional regulator [Natronosporangium hydrolyticum]QSB13789.1 MerR family transcriptional regulator [Natronosporangium hydrolyticum]